jgi:hypothetical protein
MVSVRKFLGVDAAAHGRAAAALLARSKTSTETFIVNRRSGALDGRDVAEIR